MKQDQIEAAYAIARERYAEIGVDTDKVLDMMQDFHLSLHCWQADDVTGFENRGGGLTGGIQVNGNYPGKARNIDELRKDILYAMSLIPGKHRLNLHEIYGDFGGKAVDRDQVEPEHFKSWIEWGREHDIKLDFNSTSFSHPKSGDLSLSNPDKAIRDFWIEHSKRCRAISQAIGEAQQDPCIMNTWVHDGSKDLTVNRQMYRELLKDSLDQIFEHRYDWMKDCVESKVFGIGLESYTVGSNDFYTAYAAKNNMMITLDTGHFHPTESVADKVSAMLLFVPELMLHVSRPVRWDSDHVTIMDDPTMDLFSEIVRAGALNRVHYGLDYFDGTLNRIGAYVVGTRAAQKCMLRALLEPVEILRKYELGDRRFERLGLLEECKSLPWNAVYDMFCMKNGVPVGESYIAEVQKYETDVTSKR
ncbi:MAG: L-rhamnose isomerase [Paramuribaculum sp.]|nr:L-rhamnose isomerase [Paramuribaculum sp.]MDE7470563.1 L-rhamnose isomerase [Paramuribaculum sp.]